MSDRLGPYLCDLHRAWLAEEAPTSWREQDGSLLFIDISGFTPLTERLAKRGKAGVEQLVDALNGVLAPLISTAGALGGDTLKFGGDALLLLFSGSEHARRACASAWDMQQALAPYRRKRTSAGIVSLRASAAVASGPVHLFLAGDRFTELVVAGPVTSEVMAHEHDARAGEVLLGPRTTAALDAAEFGRVRDDGVAALLARPDVTFVAPRPSPLADPRRALPAELHDHLGLDAESEHRQVTVGFVQFRGLDELLQRAGPPAAAAELDVLMSRVQHACERHGVTFLATDADRGAGKIFVVAGAPTAVHGAEDRMLFALREIVAHVGVLRVRAGVNRGRVFAVHFGAEHRRTYTTMGDTTNLAARVMGRAPDGAILATSAVLDCARAPFALTPVAPFTAKGARFSVNAALVGEPRAQRARTVDDTPLVGRDRELGVLREALAAVRAGDGRIVELVADAGMGKTRLLAEISADARLAGLRQVVIEAGSYDTSTPYLALRAPLRKLVGAEHGSDDELAAALAAHVRSHMLSAQPLLPLVAIAFGLDLPATDESARLSSDFSRQQLHFLLDRLLAALLEPRETLIVVEDAHWLDEASSELLRTVLGRAGERGWAAFVARRPSAGGLSHLPGAHMRIELEPLAPAAARSLVLAGAGAGAGGGGGGAPAPHVTAALVRRANGNPLFLRELALAARAGSELDELPETVEALLTARIDTLPPRDRRLLRRASVLGQRFPTSWLGAMLGQSEDELRDSLGRLGAFLDVESDSVRFHHALQREAAYEALPFEHRRRLHARAGEIIERELGVCADDSADILALHFLRAGEHLRAWSYGRAGADQARERFAYADAAQLYRRAIEAARSLRLPPSEMADVWEALGEVHAWSGELARANEAFTRARRLVAGDSLRVARLMHRHARAAMDGGQIVRAARWLLRGMRELEPLATAPAAACRATLASELAAARSRQDRMSEAIILCREAIRGAELAGGGAEAQAALAHACYVLDWALVESGRGGEAVHSERALAIYRRLGDLDREAAVLNNLGMFAYYEGRWDDAVALYCQGGDASTKAGNLNSAAFGDVNVGELRSDQGREQEARARLEHALEVWHGTGYQLGVAYAIALLGRVEARAGRPAEGDALLAEALERYRELRMSADTRWVEALIAESYALSGRSEPALAEADRLIAVAGRGRLAPLLHRVRGLALAQGGRFVPAVAALEEALAVARRRGDELELVLILDALHAVGERMGGADPAIRADRDEIAARLDIVRLPPFAETGAPAEALVTGS